jgi:hypothetical protein
MAINPKFDNGKVIPGEAIDSQASTHTNHRPGRTLKGDVEGLIGTARRHPRRTTAAVLAAAAIITPFVADSPKVPSSVVCVDPKKDVKGSEYGGTVSGIAADQLNKAVALGRAQGSISPSAIPNFDIELLGLTDNVAADIGTRSLNSGGTYSMSQQTCVEQAPGSADISVTSPEAK